MKAKASLRPSPATASAESIAIYDWQRSLWLITSFLAGAVVMALEMVGFRLYAPYFGYSIYVWGSMISVVMVALAVGYALGGQLADRSSTDRPLYLAILGSAAYQVLMLFTAHPLLRTMTTWDEALGTAVASLVIFGPPMITLAVVGPYLIRLLARVGHVGTTAGRIYALSTVGSIAGIVLTSFWLIPRFGTQSTLTICCVSTALLGALGLLPRSPLAAVPAVLLIGLALLRPDPRWSEATVWVGESAYNVVRVERLPEGLVLKLNTDSSVQTILGHDGALTGQYFDDCLLAPLLVPCERVLVLGMGGGASIHSTRRTAPQARFDAIEIDDVVVDVAERYFGLSRDDPLLKIHVADARPWLARSREFYDVVHVDLYHGGHYVPFYLLTREFFALVRQRMGDDGLLMMNVIDLSDSGELLLPIAQTIAQSFISLALLSRPSGNHTILAFTSPATAAVASERLRNTNAPEPWGSQARNAARALRPLTPPPGTPIFTDDHAPVESVTRRMLARYHARQQAG